MKNFKIILIGFLMMGTLTSCAGFQDSVFNAGLSLERHRSGLSLKTLQTNQKTFAYLERNGMGETILLLHGFAASKDNWIHFVRHIPKPYRIIALDMPGHGGSSHDMNQSYDAPSLAKGVAQAIDALEISRFHLIGNSLGGYVATLYAARYPQKIITLGLFDAAGVYPPTDSEFQQLLKQGDNPLLVTSRKGFERLTEFVFYDPPFMPWPLAQVMTRKFIERRELNQKMWHDIWSNREDIRELFPLLRMPVLVIWGDKDRVLHVSSVQIYEKYLPKATCVILKNCGHSPMMERPKETARYYMEFLETSASQQQGLQSVDKTPN